MSKYVCHSRWGRFAALAGAGLAVVAVASCGGPGGHDEGAAFRRTLSNPPSLLARLDVSRTQVVEIHAAEDHQVQYLNIWKNRNELPKNFFEGVKGPVHLFRLLAPGQPLPDPLKAYLGPGSDAVATPPGDVQYDLNVCMSQISREIYDCLFRVYTTYSIEVISNCATEEEEEAHRQRVEKRRSELASRPMTDPPEGCDGVEHEPGGWFDDDDGNDPTI